MGLNWDHLPESKRNRGCVGSHTHACRCPAVLFAKKASQTAPPSKVFIQEIGNSNNSLPKPSLEFIFTFCILENSKNIPHLHQPPLSLVEFAPINSKTSQAKVLNGLQVDQDVFKLSKQKEAGRHAPGRGSAWEDWILGHTSLTKLIALDFLALKD